MPEASPTLTGESRVLNCIRCGLEEHALREDGTAECGKCGVIQEDPYS